MKTQVIAWAIILGVGAVTIALAQPGNRPVTPRPNSANESTPRSSDNPRPDRPEFHDKVARLRAEVEVLQLEHDVAKERLAANLMGRMIPPPPAGLAGRAESSEGSPSQEVARDYMRIGAELVGKGSEFEAAMQEKGDEIWQAVKKAAPVTTPADLERLKQDFLQVATELNRKKIELVELEVHLEGSM